MWVLIWKILQTFTKIFLLNVSIMPDINHGSQFGKKSLGHANWPDDDWKNFLYKTESSLLVVAVVVGCFIKGLHFRLVTLHQPIEL